MPDLGTDATPDADRNGTRVEDLILARQIKRTGRPVRIVVVLTVRMVDLSAASDQPEKLALKVRMIQQDDLSTIQKRLDLLVDFRLR